jgi:putative ABC transport system permease protein
VVELFRRGAARVAALFRAGRLDRQFDEELDAHVEMLAEENVRRGMPPEEARRAALLRVGARDSLKSRHRDARGIRIVDELWRDVSYGIRVLGRSPISSAAAIATLAGGIGLNAAVFALVDWVLLRPLPYPAPHEMVQVAAAGNLTFAEFEAASRSTAFRASATFSTATRVIAGPGLEPEHVAVARVAGDLFGVLAAYPVLGRAFSKTDVSSGAPVIITSHELWRRWLSSDVNAIGRLVTIDGRAYSVIGVMPPNRGYPREADLWRPLTAEEVDDDREFVMIGRLAEDVGRERASAELAAAGGAAGTGSLWVENLQRLEAAPVRNALVGLLASSAIILFIACANIAALLGARGADRSNEFAIRRALGATRGRVTRQLLTETIVLALAGGAAGLVLGQWTLGVLLRLAPPGVPRLAEVALDSRVIAVGTGATFLIAFVVAILPARTVSHLDAPSAAVTSSVRSTRRSKGRRLLVTLQAAMAIVLTAGAILLGRSLQHLLTIDHGFVPERLVAVDLYLRGGVAPDSRQLFRDLIAAVEAVPGVRSAAGALRLPHQLVSLRLPLRVVGEPALAPETVTIRPVTPGYFATAGIRVVNGREFNERDRRDAPAAAIVNRAFVREVLGGRAALGTRVTTSLSRGQLSIVGEVPDVTPAGETDRAALYVAIEQVWDGGGSLLVRTVDRPPAVLPAIKAAMRRVSPALALDRVAEVSELLEAGQSSTRFNARLSFAFALLALFLSATGVYGLTAGEVAARRRELAVRIALGAGRRAALWSAMRPSAVAVSLGAIGGVSGALLAARWMQSLLHGVAPADPQAMLAAPLLLAVVGASASAAAAVRVLGTDPSTTLRSE